MTTLAFAVIAFMVAAYVLLDGYDLGVGAIAPIVAQQRRRPRDGDEEHRPVLERQRSLADRGRRARCSRSFRARTHRRSRASICRSWSCLWLLMFRGIAIELREHFPSPIWHQFWDVLLLDRKRAARAALRRRARQFDCAACRWIATAISPARLRSCSTGMRSASASSPSLALAFHGLLFLILRTSGALARARAAARRASAGSRSSRSCRGHRRQR